MEIVDVVEEVFGFELVAVSQAPSQIRRAAKPSRDNYVGLVRLARLLRILPCDELNYNFLGMGVLEFFQLAVDDAEDLFNLLIEEML